MAFFVDISERDLDYLRGNLSPQGFARLSEGIVSLLQNCPDSFREERRLPPPPGSSRPSSHFEVTHFFADGDQIHSIRFIVSDASMVYGVLQIVFVDSESRASP